MHGRFTAEDRLDIADLVTRFEWCYDPRNINALTDMLTEGAVIDHVWGYAEGARRSSHQCQLTGCR